SDNDGVTVPAFASCAAPRHRSPAGARCKQRLVKCVRLIDLLRPSADAVVHPNQSRLILIPHRGTVVSIGRYDRRSREALGKTYAADGTCGGSNTAQSVARHRSFYLQRASAPQGARAENLSRLLNCASKIRVAVPGLGNRGHGPAGQSTYRDGDI